MLIPCFYASCTLGRGRAAGCCDPLSGQGMSAIFGQHLNCLFSLFGCKKKIEEEEAEEDFSTAAAVVKCSRIIIERTRNNLEHFKDGRSNGQIYLRAYIYVKKYEIILLLKQHTKNEIKKKIRRWLPVGCWQVMGRPAVWTTGWTRWMTCTNLLTDINLLRVTVRTTTEPQDGDTPAWMCVYYAKEKERHSSSSSSSSSSPLCSCWRKKNRKWWGRFESPPSPTPFWLPHFVVVVVISITCPDVQYKMRIGILFLSTCFYLVVIFFFGQPIADVFFFFSFLLLSCRCSWFKREPTTARAARASCLQWPSLCWQPELWRASSPRFKRRAIPWWFLLLSSPLWPTLSLLAKSFTIGIAVLLLPRAKAKVKRIRPGPKRTKEDSLEFQQHKRKILHFFLSFFNELCLLFLLLIHSAESDLCMCNLGL